jgi:hypothetical protein
MPSGNKDSKDSKAHIKQTKTYIPSNTSTCQLVKTSTPKKPNPTPYIKPQLNLKTAPILKRILQLI